MIEVLDGGLSSTIQDEGRYGQYHIGMPPSGAMDGFAHRVANALVGNEADRATIEMTYQGCDLRFEEDAVIALAGAEMTGELAGEPISMYESVAVDADDELSLEFATTGARTYLAVAGGIDVPRVMGSRSTYTLVGIGGHGGRPLEAGDRLGVGGESAGSDALDPDAIAGRTVPDDLLPEYGETIRLVLGLCGYRLTDESREELCSTAWKVTPEADRVGYRLEGIELDFEPRDQPFGAGPDPSNVVDLGYPVGSIQVPTKPIVLMRDAVTGGGYATVATVISPDRDVLSQCRTHQSIRFEAVSVDEALEARQQRGERLTEIVEGLR